MFINRDKRNEIVFISLEDLVDQNHLLRTVDSIIDFKYLDTKYQDLYSDIGRPGFKPSILAKMKLLEYLYNIKSERELEREINDNLAFNWF